MSDRPRCPMCGEPARYEGAVRYVFVDIGGSGRPPRLGKLIKGYPTTYRCGGNHTWTTDAEEGDR